MAGFSLPRRRRTPALISVVPLIDVLMILLIFFMVTSSYLELDMVPVVQDDDPGVDAAPPESPGLSGTLLVRLQADGTAVIAGQRLDPDSLRRAVADRLRAAPDTPVVILPAANADTQALISLMDTLTDAGAAQVRVIRIEGGP